jgi:hypothetical protein
VGSNPLQQVEQAAMEEQEDPKREMEQEQEHAWGNVSEPDVEEPCVELEQEPS